jgi:hypothetical protein
VNVHRSDPASVISFFPFFTPFASVFLFSFHDRRSASAATSSPRTRSPTHLASGPPLPRSSLTPPSPSSRAPRVRRRPFPLQAARLPWPLPDRAHTGSCRHGRRRPLTPARGCRIPPSHFPTLQSPLRSTQPPHRCAYGSTLSSLLDRHCPVAPLWVSWVVAAARSVCHCPALCLGSGYIRSSFSLRAAHAAASLFGGERGGR